MNAAHFQTSDSTNLFGKVLFLIEKKTVMNARKRVLTELFFCIKTPKLIPKDTQRKSTVAVNGIAKTVPFEQNAAEK